MITLTLLNIAWQSLLLSVLGWALVGWCVRDARRRAWAAALALLVSALVPLALVWVPHQKKVESIAPSTTLWKPDWKVKIAPAAPVMLSFPSTPASPTKDGLAFIRQGQSVWMAGFLLLCFLHLVKTLIAWRWQSKLKPSPNNQVRVFSGSGSPCVVGVIKPVIAVSETACATLTHDQWRWLLAHEGEHLRGHDAAVAWAFGWLRAWLWWNPFVHLIIGEWAQAREEVCDAAAVGGTSEGENYANFLLEIAANPPLIAAFSMAASRPARRLRARLLAVLDGRQVRDRVGSDFIFFAASVIVGCVLAVNCSGVEEGPLEQPKTIHVYSVFVEPADFIPHVQRMMNEGSALISPNTVDLLSKASEANLKNPKGETVKVIKTAPVATQFPQVFIQAKFIEASKSIGEDSKSYTEADVKTLVELANQENAVDVLSSPSVTTRMGQKAAIQVGAERPQHPDEFAGILFEAEPTMMPNGSLNLKGKATVANELDAAPSTTNKSHAIDWAKVKRWTKDYSLDMKPQETRVLHMGETTKGRFITILVTATAIDGTGKDLAKGFKDQAPPPQTEDIKNRRIYITSKIVEYDSKPGDEAPFVHADKMHPGAKILGGVFTDPQFQVIIRALSQKKGIKIIVLPSSTAKPAEQVLVKSEPVGYNVTPTIRPDETIDLLVSSSDAKAIKTAVTILDGQTIVIQELVSEDKEKGAKHWRLLFVTANIIELKANQKK